MFTTLVAMRQREEVAQEKTQRKSKHLKESQSPPGDCQNGGIATMTCMSYSSGYFFDGHQSCTYNRYI